MEKQTKVKLNILKEEAICIVSILKVLTFTSEERSNMDTCISIKATLSNVVQEPIPNEDEAKDTLLSTTECVYLFDVIKSLSFRVGQAKDLKIIEEFGDKLMLKYNDFIKQK